MDIASRLVITPPMYFEEPASKCGYCKGEKAPADAFSLNSWAQESLEDGNSVRNSTLGFQCENLTVEMYDSLCNRGFRRSGRFLYKPDLLRTCCRLYTIRTTPEQMHPSKEYRSCVRRFCKLAGAPQTPSQPFDYIRELTAALADDSCRLTTRFEPATYTEEKYALFAKYQEEVHADFKHNKRSFERFLCDSPFPDEVQQGTSEEWAQLNAVSSGDCEDGPTDLLRLGPAHECYYLDGTLIAVAVTDFLPSGLSSVYFIWDPAFRRWSLGKVSAMRELALLSRTTRPYYYLGYYVEDCSKMNYKAAYGGDLLDVTAARYYPLDELRQQGALDHGHLFAYSGEDDHGERERELDGLLDLNSYERCDVGEDSGLRNVAEEVYGAHGAIAQNQQDYASIVETLQKYGIDYSYDDYAQLYGQSDSDSPEGIRPLPNVVPGMLPLHELLGMVESNRMNQLNGSLLIYDTQMLRIRPVFDFYSEPESIKTALCNVVRVLGLRLAKRTLVII